MTMTLVSTVEVGAGGAASIDFSSIPSTGTDLVIVTSLRENVASGTTRNIRMRFNGNTSDVYSTRYLYGDGSSAASSTDSSGFGFFNWVFTTEGTSATSNTFSSNSFYIPNYAVASNKSVSLDSVNENNATQAIQSIQAGLFASTSTISSISIYSGSTWLQYSTASLYTVTKGSGGATVS